MPVAEIKSNTKVSARMEIINNGRLIHAEKSPFPRIWRGFHAWRCDWCTKYRNKWTPPGLREGKINPLTIGFYLFQKYIRR